MTGSSELNFKELGVGGSLKEQGGNLPTFRPRSYTGKRTDLSAVRARFSTLGNCTLREHLATYRDTLGCHSRLECYSSWCRKSRDAVQHPTIYRPGLPSPSSAKEPWVLEKGGEEKGQKRRLRRRETASPSSSSPEGWAKIVNTLSTKPVCLPFRLVRNIRCWRHQ